MRRFLAFAIVALLLFAGFPARAAEEILNYAARIEIGADGVLDVTETLIVRAEGDNIRRGIYRDFPTRFLDKDGNIKHVSFDVISVTRDGEAEANHSESNGNFTRLYLGSAETFLSPGEYTYELRYRTDRQLRQFDDHDELYWNVTGTEWAFPILKASALVVLPNGAKATDLAVFTGFFGSTDKNARAQMVQSGAQASFTTTQPLQPRQGMTIVVAFPKGAIAAPTFWQTLIWYLRDHMGSVLAIGGLLLAGVYYLRSWLKVGVDPKGGTIVPRWDMPD